MSHDSGGTVTMSLGEPSPLTKPVSPSAWTTLLTPSPTYSGFLLPSQWGLAPALISGYGIASVVAMFDTTSPSLAQLAVGASQSVAVPSGEPIVYVQLKLSNTGSSTIRYTAFRSVPNVSYEFDLTVTDDLGTRTYTLFMPGAGLSGNVTLTRNT